MPRTKKVVEEPVTPVEQKARKPYPGRDERVDMAHRQIARLEALIANRKTLIEATEAKLHQRKEALMKNEQALEKTIAKKERIIAANVKSIAKKPGVRAIKAAEKAKIAELNAALEASGKSLDDILDMLKK